MILLYHLKEPGKRVVVIIVIDFKEIRLAEEYVMGKNLKKICHSLSHSSSKSTSLTLFPIHRPASMRSCQYSPPPFVMPLVTCQLFLPTLKLFFQTTRISIFLNTN